MSVGSDMVGVAVGVGVSAASASGESTARGARVLNGQSSAVSRYSIGDSAMYSSGRRLPNGVGRLVVSTSESDTRPSLPSWSDSLYQIVS